MKAWDPIPEIKMVKGRHRLNIMSSFVHLLNLVWCPCYNTLGASEAIKKHLR